MWLCNFVYFHAVSDFLFCPSISEDTLEPKDLTKGKIRKCPNGEELMMDAKISFHTVGGVPYIVHDQEGKIHLGQGRDMAALELLSRKFGFQAIPKPAPKNVVMFLGNVSTIFSWHSS